MQDQMARSVPCDGAMCERWENRARIFSADGLVVIQRWRVVSSTKICETC